MPFPVSTLTISMPSFGRRASLRGDLLLAHTGAGAMREHDGADHGSEQNNARRLERQQVIGIKHIAQRLGVGDGSAVGNRHRCRNLLQRLIERDIKHKAQFEQDDRRHKRAHRQVAQEALAQLDEIDIEHHDDEQEQHGHRADIYNDEDHGNELGAEA